ncbi:hypothetical protein [Aliikangiella sp. IMCC44359]|uniref:hypothetical protein n=1 Tax=Aliikangiella sp. IMCC44359 TaxID=3459125 RepID=UPI00403AED39
MSTEYQSLTWRQMAAYHEELREVIFADVESTYAALGIKAHEISYKDVKEADKWKKIWTKENRVASWGWLDLYEQYHSRGGARRFDLALSKAGALISLCYGMLERDRLILKLHAIEHSPLKNKVLSDSILDINLYAADLYAQLNGSRELWLCDPVSPAHTRLYRGKGYKPYENHFGKVTHLVKKL